MPRLKFPIAAGGAPVVDVSLEPSLAMKQWLSRNGGSPMLAANISLLVETGSEATVVPGSRIVNWGLPPPVSGFTLLTVAGKSRVPAVELDIHFFDDKGCPATSIARVLVGLASGRPWPSGHPYQGVLGRDVLDRLQMFSYGGSPKACYVDY